jgi:hypothetical protein
MTGAGNQARAGQSLVDAPAIPVALFLPRPEPHHSGNYSAPHRKLSRRYELWLSVALQPLVKPIDRVREVGRLLPQARGFRVDTCRLGLEALEIIHERTAFGI